MKILISLTMIAAPFLASAGSTFDTHYRCEGVTEVTFGLNALTVEGKAYKFINASKAAGQHEDGESYAATAYEFAGGWVFVMADESNDTAVLVNGTYYWYCKKNNHQ